MRIDRQHRPPRVAYDTGVKLQTRSCAVPFAGRAVNLSPTGLLVRAAIGDATCAVGEEIFCDLPLPGGTRRLRGRVTRCREPVATQLGEPPAGDIPAMDLGIAFEGVSASERTLIEDVVETDRRARPVRVRFEGMPEPLRSRAVLIDEGIRLHTPLPFLRENSVVEVTIEAGNSQVVSRGFVRDVHLLPRRGDGVPRLAVDLVLDGRPPEVRIDGPLPDVTVPQPGGHEAPETKPRGPDVPAVPAVAPADPPSEEAEADSSSHADRSRAPRARTSSSWRRTAGVAVISIGASAMGGLVLSDHLILRQMSAQIVQIAETTQIIKAAQTVSPAVAPPLAPPPASREAVVAPPDPSLATAEPAVSPAQISFASLKVAPVRIPEPWAEGTPGPGVSQEGDLAILEIPLEGSLMGARSHPIDHPKGVSVELPAATSALPSGLHAVRRGGVRFVWIRNRPRGGIQVRFTFTTPPPESALVDLSPGVLRLRVRPSRR